MRQKRMYEMSGLLAMFLFAGCCNDENGIDGSNPVEIRLTSGLTVQQVGIRAGTDIQGSQFGSGEKVDGHIREEGQTSMGIWKRETLEIDSYFF